MKVAFAILLLMLAVIAPARSQNYPPLPDPLTTSKGTFNSPKILNVTGDSVRIFHDGGITPVSASDLPPDVAKALGFTPTAPAAFPKLPDPFRVKEASFGAARITAVEPDGIRIAHAAGTSKIMHEDLDAALQSALGGFDADKAAAYRGQAQQAHAAAMQEVQRVKESVRASDIAAANKALEQSEPVTENPSIRLTAKTVGGGRNTSVTWSTTWGSFNKESVSTRIIAVTVSTVARNPQKADVEVLFLWRNQGNRELEFTTTGKKQVTVVDGHPAVIAGEDQAEDTHDKYNALGVEEKTGRRYVAWVVRATDSKGKVVAAYASIPSYEKYAYAKLDP